ncbi:hypothetical protein GGS26DRAFT_598486 [Hypomontagnella submonticulosa]|nr:hypothetical protein GGS26DRAFT_598486 [Hypomontagnella submonticulosa]
MEQPNESQLGSISLMPEEAYELNRLDQLWKRDFKELFTYNSRESTTSDNDYPRPTIRDLKAPLPSQEKSPTPPVRILFTPGRAPFPQGFSQRSSQFRTPAEYSIASPEFAFEDLCRIAKHTQKLNEIKSANFVTDARTLTALFDTFYNFLIRESCFARVEGISLTFQTIPENNTTFMKSLNTYGCDPNACDTASKHMKSRGFKWPLIAGEASIKLDSFKRVVSYGLGEFDLVVEVDNNQSHYYGGGILKANVPPYAIFADGDSKSWATENGVGIFTLPDYKSDPLGISSQMWFSGTPKALIAKYTRLDDVGRHRFLPGLEEFELRDVRRGDGDQYSPVDSWASSEIVETALKMLYRFLKCIKETVHALAYDGKMKFLLEHMTLADDEMIISLTMDGVEPIDLVSPGIARDLAQDPEDPPPDINTSEPAKQPAKQPNDQSDTDESDSDVDVDAEEAEYLRVLADVADDCGINGWYEGRFW